MGGPFSQSPQPQPRDRSHCSPAPVLATLPSLLWRQKSDIRGCAIGESQHLSTHFDLGTFVTLLLVSLSNPFALPREFRRESSSLTCTTSVPVNCTGSSQVGHFSICSSADRPQLNQTTPSAREPTFYQLH